MPEAILEITPELLCDLLKGLKSGDDARQFRVAKNPLPDDAEVVDVKWGRSSRCVRLIIASRDVQSGEVLEAPVLELVKPEPFASVTVNVDQGDIDAAIAEVMEEVREMRNDGEEWKNT